MNRFKREIKIALMWLGAGALIYVVAVLLGVSEDVDWVLKEVLALPQVV